MAIKRLCKFFIQEMVPACDHGDVSIWNLIPRWQCLKQSNGGWFGSMVSAGLLDDIPQEGLEWIKLCLQWTTAAENCGSAIYRRNNRFWL